MSAFGTTQCKATGVRGNIHIGRWPVAASQTFKAFDFLTVDASNAAIQGVAAGSRMGAVSGNQNRVLGRALEDALDETGTLRTSVGIIFCQPGVEFELPLDHGTPASAVATPSSGQLLTSGFECKNVNTNGGYYAVSLDNTTNKVWVIKDYVIDDLSTWPNATTSGTTQYPRVWAEALPAASWTSIQS